MRIALIRTSMLAVLMMVLAGFMFGNLQLVYESSVQGLKIWLEIVFPAVFPVLVLSELMVGLGIVHFLGVLLEPIMRPLFRVPGSGGFAVAMGFISSYPVGARLAALLRAQKLVTRSEGERLLCFASTADPMFILVAISVGIFHDASLGVVIAGANFTAAILLGLLLRFHDRKGASSKTGEDQKGSLFLRAIRRMSQAQIDERRRLMEILSDAVNNAFQTLFGIGAFMVVFSVIIKFASTGVISEVLVPPLAWLLSALQFPEQLAHSLVVGFLEVTQSMRSVSDAVGPDMKSKIVVASALVAWGGISVHTQVASIISSTDIRYKPYFLYKIVHALLAGVIAFFIWEPMQGQLAWLKSTVTVFTSTPNATEQYGWTTLLVGNLTLMAATLLGFFMFVKLVRYLSHR
ncbi:sporulation integral membrane protein YlbJ [Tumebacillus permanentifrigoris]|uniref:Sporulation integral membrane protein YlbJ n=1 Tax=Tumebacillus permanentifrigoris TaxID=378543 RepID=A0A316D4B4_9BACL|nr:sporulation integral membrane protein YlbJ [Tumebacillus permanentifrigoris]PWK06659.1 sporulation integral membrane protein YlbJ [Tumebacillus permanentifrigoris]